MTVKQEKFVKKYLECGNASEAYRHAYNAENMKPSSVQRKAKELLDDGKITARLEYLKSHLAEAADISALRVIAEHMKIAFSDATRLRNGWMTLKEFESLTPEERACIKAVETKTRKIVNKNGEIVIDEQVKVTLYDKQKALDSISRMLGYDAPAKVEVSGMALNITTDEETKRIIEKGL